MSEKNKKRRIKGKSKVFIVCVYACDRVRGTEGEKKERLKT